jgi:hypothetical protein
MSIMPMEILVDETIQVFAQSTLLVLNLKQLQYPFSGRMEKTLAEI